MVAFSFSYVMSRSVMRYSSIYGLNGLMHVLGSNENCFLFYEI